MTMKWISVKDSLPLEDEKVLAVTDNNEVGVGRMTRIFYIKSEDKLQWVVSDVADYHEVIYWIPFPTFIKPTSPNESHF